MPDGEATTRTRKRYDRIAALYDLIEAPMEALFLRRWRARLFAQLPAGRTLEVGVGTGKNLPFYASDAQLTAIDLSERMLKRARRKASRTTPDFRLMSAEQLAFEDGSFDAVVATCVFCSVPDPVRGFQEIRRVVKPGGPVLLLEHVRPEGRFLGALFDLLNPLVVRLIGANINRRTLENIEKAGLKIRRSERLSTVFRLIVAER